MSRIHRSNFSKILEAEHAELYEYVIVLPSDYLIPEEQLSLEHKNILNSFRREIALYENTNFEQ